jgi:alanine racemase
VTATSTTTSDGAPRGDFGELIYRPNSAKVDLGAIRDNTQIVKGLLRAGTTLFGAVKCNGYGLGLPAVAEAMLAGGIDGFTLSDPADAVRIRTAGIDIPILLYGGILPSPDVTAALRRFDLMCTVTDESSARAYSAANNSHNRLKVFVKVDIGLERLGIYAEEGLRFVRAVRELPGIELAGIYSHILGGEPAKYRQWQLDRFERLLRELAAAGIEVPLRMSESSASLGLHAENSANAVDPGHLLYGIAPRGRPGRPGGLRPAFRGLASRIIQVKDFKREEFLAESPVPAGRVRRFGIVPIGRGDGLQHLTTGQVRVRGQLVPIVGGLSLEHARIDLTGVPGCQAGDEVEIISPEPDSVISVERAAAANHTDLVGLQVAIAPSIPRAYAGLGTGGGWPAGA